MTSVHITGDEVNYVHGVLGQTLRSASPSLLGGGGFQANVTDANTKTTVRLRCLMLALPCCRVLIMSTPWVWALRARMPVSYSNHALEAHSLLHSGPLITMLLHARPGPHISHCPHAHPGLPLGLTPSPEPCGIGPKHHRQAHCASAACQLGPKSITAHVELHYHCQAWLSMSLWVYR